MRVKKKEEKELENKLKSEQKKIKKRAEITKQRLNIDPTYVDFKNQSEEAEISTSMCFRKINRKMQNVLS